MNPLQKAWERIRRFFVGRKEPPYEEWAEKILNEEIEVPKSHGKYPQLKRHLVAFLSNENNVDALYEWSSLLSSVVWEQVSKKIEEKEEELKAEYRKKVEKGPLDNAMSKAVKSGLLSLSDEIAIDMLEYIAGTPSSLTELKSQMELGQGARWRLRWLRSLGLVESALGKEESAIYETTERGKKMLKDKGEPLSSQKSLEDQRREVAEMAAGENTTADELLNVLDGDWLEKHRDDLEKIRKKYENPLVKISKSFWLKREGGDPHLKHADIDIEDHEASGALLCLELLSIHAKDRRGSESQNPWGSLFGKKSGKVQG